MRTKDFFFLAIFLVISNATPTHAQVPSVGATKESCGGGPCRSSSGSSSSGGSSSGVYTPPPPSPASIAFNEGVAAENAERWEDAAKAFRRAVELNPTANNYAHLVLALDKLAIRNNGTTVVTDILDQAIEICRKGFHQYPQDKWLRENLAVLLYSKGINFKNKGDKAQAERYLKEAVEVNPDDTLAREKLSELNQEKANAEELRRNVESLATDLNKSSTSGGLDFMTDTSVQKSAQPSSSGLEFSPGNANVSPGTSDTTAPKCNPPCSGGGTARQQADAAAASGKAATTSGLSGGDVKSGEASSDKAREVFDTPGRKVASSETSNIVDASKVKPTEFPQWVRDNPKIKARQERIDQLEVERTKAEAEYQKARATLDEHEQQGRSDPQEEFRVSLGLAYSRSGNELPAIAWLHAYLAAVPQARNTDDVRRESQKLQVVLEAKIHKLLQTAVENIDKANDNWRLCTAASVARSIDETGDVATAKVVMDRYALSNARSVANCDVGVPAIGYAWYLGFTGDLPGADKILREAPDIMGERQTFGGAWLSFARFWKDIDPELGLAAAARIQNPWLSDRDKIINEIAASKGASGTNDPLWTWRREGDFCSTKWGITETIRNDIETKLKSIPNNSLVKENAAFFPMQLAQLATDMSRELLKMRAIEKKLSSN